jgi:hypothetical protein
MPKAAQVIAIQEAPGEIFPDLETAQRAALPLLVDSMLAVIQELLDSGDIVVVDNELKPSTNKANDEI